MSNDRLKYLLKQYATDASTPAEIRELFRWISKSNNDILLKEKMEELWGNYGSDKELPDVDWDEIYTRIISTPMIGKRNIWQRYAAAAAVLVLISIGGYFLLNRESEKMIVQDDARVIQDEIVPGGDRAILTLADGTRVVLDSADAGTLSQQGNVRVIKLENGQLSYQFAENANSSTDVLYNTISTPRGGQYQIVLADGSRVWLNAASSLRFPASFRGKERVVELTGEGYFEVAHNAEKPFKVSVSGMEVKVLGTHFNVSAYSDETNIKTTLLEGSVMIEKNGKVRKIAPGEQARVSNQGGAVAGSDITVRSVNVEDAIAWKDGRFIFHDDNIYSVMQQLARWYDVSVSYEGDVTNEEFVGVINRSRYEDISEILDMLEKTRTVSFMVIGRHVTVKPYEKRERSVR